MGYRSECDISKKGWVHNMNITEYQEQGGSQAHNTIIFLRNIELVAGCQQQCNPRHSLATYNQWHLAYLMIMLGYYASL